MARQGAGHAAARLRVDRGASRLAARGRFPRSHGHGVAEQTTHDACSRRPREAGPRSLRGFRATRWRRSCLRARRPHQPIATSSPRPPDAWPRARRNIPRQTPANPAVQSRAPGTKPAARLRQWKSLLHSSRSLPLGRHSRWAQGPVGRRVPLGMNPWLERASVPHDEVGPGRRRPIVGES